MRTLLYIVFALQIGQGYSIKYLLQPTAGNKGWGYQVYKDDKLIINQPYIPAITGAKKFASKKDAAAVAGLMVKKMQHNVFPPALSVHEIDSLKIKH